MVVVNHLRLEQIGTKKYTVVQRLIEKETLLNPT